LARRSFTNVVGCQEFDDALFHDDVVEEQLDSRRIDWRSGRRSPITIGSDLRRPGRAG
jgi:hypothetical protein